MTFKKSAPIQAPRMKYWKRKKKKKRLLYLGSSLKLFTHENGGEKKKEKNVKAILSIIDEGTEEGALSCIADLTMNCCELFWKLIR